MQTGKIKRLLKRWQKPAIPIDSKRVSDRIAKLKTARTDPARTKRLNIGMAAGGLAGLTWTLYENNHDFRIGILTIASCALSVGWASAAKSWSQLDAIRNATLLVGRALGEEARDNEELIKFLKKNRFVIVDGQGNIRGTDKYRILGIGRIRLKSSDILTRKY